MVENPVFDAVCDYTEREDFEEELRILYVVLTRARERLFVVGTCPKDDREEYCGEMRLYHEHLSGYSVRCRQSFLDIILSATGFVPIDEGELLSGVCKDCEVKAPSGVQAEPIPYDAQLYRKIKERFEFEYPYPYDTTLPEKLSVSRASPTVLDGTEGERLISAHTDEGEGEEKEHLPAFIEGSAADESAKRGIATHYFLQFCELERFKKIGAKEELAELLRLGFISKRDAERVRLSEIKRFAESRLFADMLSAKSLYRELRFNIHVPCKYFTEDELRLQGVGDETVLVQGVIDCVVEMPDGTLCVYDYKTDRLSAEELDCRERAERKMEKRHRRQLEYYALAVEEIFGKKPSRVEVYSLHFGDTLSVGI
jgi:ATP-dependent helicase/nuclease subunit A